MDHASRPKRRRGRPLQGSGTRGSANGAPMCRSPTMPGWVCWDRLGNREVVRCALLGNREVAAKTLGGDRVVEEVF